MRIAIAFCCAATITALAGASEEINEIEKILPWDLGNGDSFGSSVALSLTRTLAGAPLDDLGGENAGAAYIHVTATGQQLYKLTASDSMPNSRFGSSVTATGSNAIVGAPLAAGNESSSGAVYVFNMQNGQQNRKLLAPDGATGDQFGYSVSARGARVLIGAWADDDGGTQSGSAYIMDLTTGQQVYKLVGSDAAPFDFFGHAVAISSTLAVVGAWGCDTGNATRAGAAYVFDLTTGQQLFKIDPPNPESDGMFGISVAIGGDLIVVGSRESGGLGPNAGAIYFFDANTGQFLRRVASTTISEGDFFGDSVSTNGSIVVAGAFGENNGNGNLAGAAFVFDALSGHEIYRLVSSELAASDVFGGSVAVLGNRAFVGAIGDDSSGLSNGAAYVFDITPCFADVNNDNTVNLVDLNIILASFGQTTPIGDTNFDGIVDLTDLNTLLSEFGTDCPQ